MFLSNRDIKWAIECGQFTVDPPPEDPPDGGYDETSIDLHLGPVASATVWDVDGLVQHHATAGTQHPEVLLGTFRYGEFSGRFLKPPPNENGNDPVPSVTRRGNLVIVRPGGFVLWATLETVGTPKLNPTLIAFVNAKSTKARTGLLVHMTAPTIHAGWEGKIILEIANLGPLHFVLQEGDAIAQLTVAKISSSPDLTLKAGESQTQGQQQATGSQEPPRQRGSRQRRRRN